MVVVKGLEILWVGLVASLEITIGAAARRIILSKSLLLNQYILFTATRMRMFDLRSWTLATSQRPSNHFLNLREFKLESIIDLVLNDLQLPFGDALALRAIRVMDAAYLRVVCQDWLALSFV